MNECGKRCWTEINLSAIIENYRIYKSNLLENQKVMAVVKADAYGHGDVEVAAALQKEGVQDFAVATVDEAVNLRKSGISGQILILGYTPICEVDSLLAYDITQAIPDEVYAQRLCKVSGAKDVKVHFVLDTGMNRIGLDADNPVYCENVIRKYYDKFNVSGIFTHLCVADCDDENSVEFTKGQIAKFEAVVQKTEDLHIPFVHCLNSAGGAGGYLKNQSVSAYNGGAVVVGAAQAASSVGEVSVNAVSGKNGGTGGGGGGYHGSGGVGDGISKYPFGDESYSLWTGKPHCGGGGGGAIGSNYEAFERAYDGGKGGTNGGSGAESKPDNNLGRPGYGGSGGSYGGAAGASASDMELASGGSATYYGSGGGGGAYYYYVYSEETKSVTSSGGSGYQGIVYMRIPVIQ